MTIIIAISLISWAIVITIIASGAIIENEGCTMCGSLLLIVVLTAHAFFQIGAHWQVEDTIEKYEIVNKSKL